MSFQLGSQLGPIAGLTFLFAFAAGLAPTAAPLDRRKRAHRALCAAAIFLLTEALIVLLMFDAAVTPDLL